MSEDTSSLLDRLIDQAENQTAAPQKSPVSIPTDGASPFGALLSNPEILSKLPSIMSAVGSLSGGAKSGSESAKHTGQHTALLCALKPYLNSERRRAADTILNFLRIEEVLRTLPLNTQATKKEEDNVQQSVEQ